MNPNSSRSSRWVRRFLQSPWPVILLLGCHLALGLSAVSRKSPTSDEGVHLVGGLSYWARSDYRINPESGNWLQRWAALPFWLEGQRFSPQDNPAWQSGNEWDFTTHFLYASGNDSEWLVLQGRGMIGLLSVALGLVVYVWSRRLFGATGGLISLALYVFSPTLLSNGFLITADLASALGFTVSLGALWLLFHRVSGWTIAASSLSLAGLILSKFSGVLIVPMGLVLLGIRLWMARPLLLIWWSRSHEVRGRLQQLALLCGALAVELLVVVGLIWASYGFRYTTVNPNDPSQHPLLPAWDQITPSLGTIGPVVQFLGEHHWLPEPFLYGFTYTVSSTEYRKAFLNGEFGLHGWVSFFPYCLAVKTPLAVFGMLLLAVGGAWCWRDTTPHKSDLPATGAWDGPLYGSTPLWVLLGVYWLVSLTSHLNIGQRHLLPTYPPMFILAGAAGFWFQAWPRRVTARAAVSSPDTPSRGVWLARLCVLVCLSGALVAGLWIWPDYLAYFNILAGGPSQGYRHLVDSSLDWGQDLKELKRWLQRHPHDAQDPQRLYLSYFGQAIPPAYYDLKLQSLPGFPFDAEHRDIPQPLTGGTYCISATMLQGVLLGLPGRWNARYEKGYQAARNMMQEIWKAAADPNSNQKQAANLSQSQLSQLYLNYEMLRTARLFSFLRQREPDDNVGHSILIYRLSDADVQHMLDDPPVELLPDCEPAVKELLGIQ